MIHRNLVYIQQPTFRPGASFKPRCGVASTGTSQQQRTPPKRFLSFLVMRNDFGQTLAFLLVGMYTSSQNTILPLEKGWDLGFMNMNSSESPFDICHQSSRRMASLGLMLFLSHKCLQTDAAMWAFPASLGLVTQSKPAAFPWTAV